MKVASDFRQIARGKLGEKWTKAPWSTFAIAALIAILISVAISTLANALGTTSVYELDGVEYTVKSSNTFVELAGSLLVTNIISFAMNHMALKVVDGKSIEIGDVFYGYKKFGRAFVCELLLTIFISLWMLLLIIPGIIMAFAYAMTPFIVLEDDNISIMDAIKKSKEMMRGNKWRLFCLVLSFIGWLLLGIITCGIVLIWVEPYMSTAIAAFYRDLKPAQIENEFAEEVKFEEKAENLSE